VRTNRVTPLVRTAVEPDPLQAALATGESPDRLLAHAHSSARERPALTVQARRAVGAQHDIAAPPGHHQRRASPFGTAALDGQRTVANLPAVTERAVEDRPAPQWVDTRRRRRVVAQPVREHESPRVERGSAGEPHGESLLQRLGVEHRVVANLHGGVVGELFAAGAAQFGGVDAALGQ